MHFQFLYDLCLCIVRDECSTHLYVYLVNKGPSVGVGLQKHTGPKIWVSAAHQVTGQTLEQRVFIAHL